VYNTKYLRLNCQGSTSIRRRPRESSLRALSPEKFGYFSSLWLFRSVFSAFAPLLDRARPLSGGRCQQIGIFGRNYQFSNLVRFAKISPIGIYSCLQSAGVHCVCGRSALTSCRTVGVPHRMRGLQTCGRQRPSFVAVQERQLFRQV